MKTQPPLVPQFSFAGFSWPKYVWTLPNGNLRKRLERAINRCTGDYSHAPRPEQAGKGGGFYLESAGMPGLRWAWADAVDGARVDHKGWFTNDHHDGDTIRGLIFRLPRSRGFLAGWSMGESMASSVDCDVYETEIEAARAADDMAERAAESEREYQAKEDEEREEEQERAEAEEEALELELEKVDRQALELAAV